MPQSRRRVKTRSTRKADSVFGYLIPLFLMVLAGYQQYKNNHVDTWVLGSVVAFGLAALGWNIDSMFETWVLARESLKKSDDEDEPETDTEDVEKDGE